MASMAAGTRTGLTTITPTADKNETGSCGQSPGTETIRLLLLQTWLSPSFPVGSFSYSHGLEYAIDTGVVNDEAGLRSWIADLISIGSGWADAVLLAASWRARNRQDLAAVRDLAELTEALAPSRERHLETVRQGAAFLDAVRAGWPSRGAAGLLGKGDTPYPVAVGATGAEHGIPLAQLLPAWLNAFASTLISVAVRLVPLGQLAGLRTISILHPQIAQAAQRAAASSLDDLGSATVFSDIVSMRHEQQYSRVFRT